MTTHDALDKAKRWMRSKLAGEELVPIDVKTQPRLTKACLTILEFCQNKDLNLKNSPPFLQGIISDTQELLNEIFTHQPLEQLRSIEYFIIFVPKFLRHCKKTTTLFKESKEAMMDETAPCRRQLTKLTLVFSHILAELKAVFVEGKYTEEFKIVKIEARQFWERYIGNKRFGEENVFVFVFVFVFVLC